MPKKNYYKFQIEDSDKMEAIGNSLNLSQPGVGKSAVLIKLIAGRSLVIVPKSVLYQIEAEIHAFRPELLTTVIIGSPAQRKKLLLSANNVVLLTYEIFRINIGILTGLLPFQTLLFDEVHRLADHTTKTHKAVRYLLKNSPSLRIYGFTASLIMNSPMDCYGVFSIFRPQLFPNWLNFTLRYMFRNSMGWLVSANKTNLPELGEKIRPYYVKRTLAEVAPQLPPHLDEVITFDLSSAERKLYNQIRAELIFELDPKHVDNLKNPLSIQNALTRMQVLSELTDSPDIIGHSDIPSTKIQILQEKLAELLTGNQRKCVVFSRFARMINILFPLLSSTGYNPVVIQGSVTGIERQENINRFKSDPSCRIMLMTTAGSEGISLEEAQYLIRLDTPFSIGRDIQLTGRIRRITSLEPTFSYTLCAKGTVDEKMLKILSRKKEMHESVFNLSDIEELLT